jgi:ATP-dependent Lon protease
LSLVVIALILRGGSLLKANGGFLIVNCMDVLSEVGVWKTLMRTLQSETLQIQNYVDSLGYAIHIHSASISTLKPKPIPLSVKVVLIGNPRLYHLLSHYEDNFLSTFKIKADFDWEAPLTSHHVQNYVKTIHHFQQTHHTLPINTSGIKHCLAGKVIRLVSGMCGLLEHAVRLASHKKKMSTQFFQLEDIIVEANYW